MSVSQSPGGTSGGLQGVQTISTRARKISKSKNDLDQIPIATPLLGETQGQISNTKNIQSTMCGTSANDGLEVIRKYLREQSETVAADQLRIGEKIIRIDKKISEIDQILEDRARGYAAYDKELNKIEITNQISSKMSNSMRNLAVKLNQINASLPEDKRLPKFTFD